MRNGVSEMKVRELAVPGAWEITPNVHGDSRGMFFEWLTDRGFSRSPAIGSTCGKPIVRCHRPVCCAACTSPRCPRARPSM